MNICIGSAVGAGKFECEDCAFGNEILVDNKVTSFQCNDLRCVGVADGVGGNAGGRMASHFVASKISQADFTPMTACEIQRFLTKVNEELIHCAAKIPGKEEMATTLTGIVTGLDGLYLIHVGNSRLYVMQGAYLRQLTSDHTTYNWLLECGQYEAADRCNKSEINSCLGGGNTQFGRRIVVQKLFDESMPDRILLTTDGVHEYLDIDSMEDILAAAASDAEGIRQLLQQATINGSTDDKTAIIVRRCV